MPLRLLVALVATAAGLVFAAEPEKTSSPDASAEPAARPPADVKLELFLLIGQSNMAGRGKIEPEDRRPHPRVWTLKKSDEWTPAVDPLHWDKPKVAGVGLGKTFGQTVADAPGNESVHVGLIPCAFGGTSIDKWKKGDALYDEAVRRARVALKHGRLAGVLWHQGESDSGSEAKRAAYPAKLERLIADLRSDLNAPDAPFILGQLGPFHETKAPGSKPMSALLLAFPKTHPNTACAAAEGLTDIGDGTHFDARSLREFGRRYAEAYLKLAGKTPASK
jgi:hypothetical protein